MAFGDAGASRKTPPKPRVPVRPAPRPAATPLSTAISQGAAAAPRPTVASAISTGVSRARPTPAPVSDVRSSGRDYGKPAAEAHRRRERERASRPATFQDGMRSTLAQALWEQSSSPRPSEVNRLTGSVLAAYLAAQSPKAASRTYARVVAPSARYVEQEMWRAAAPYFNRSPASPVPESYVVPRRPSDDAYASTYGTGSRFPFIDYPADMAEDVSGYSPDALETLVHEWAHYHQRGQPQGDRLRSANGGSNPILEGGAEAFTKNNIRGIVHDAGLGGQYEPGYLAYPGFVREVRRARSPWWIDHGQFR